MTGRPGATPLPRRLLRGRPTVVLRPVDVPARMVEPVVYPGSVAAGEIPVRLEPALHPFGPELLPLEAGRFPRDERSIADALVDALLLVPLPLIDPPGGRRDRNRHREGGEKSCRKCFLPLPFTPFPSEMKILICPVEPGKTENIS